jgi:hypothetical protein
MPIAVSLFLATGCQTPKDYDMVIARFFVEINPAGGYAENMVLPLSQVDVPVSPKPVISEIDIVDVDLVQVDIGLCLNFKLTAAAARDLYRLSVNNLGRRLVLTLNGVPYGVRRMNTPLSYGEIMIFAELSDEDLEEMVKNLKGSSADIQKAAESGG